MATARNDITGDRIRETLIGSTIRTDFQPQEEEEDVIHSLQVLIDVHLGNMKVDPAYVERCKKCLEAEFDTVKTILLGGPSKRKKKT